MKILLLTAGTRSDVEPFAALARSAGARGHQVRLGVPDHCGVDTAGLDTVSLRMDFAQLISDQGVFPWAMATTFKTVIRPAVGRLLSTAVGHIITFAPDVMVYHPKILSAPIAADRIGIPSAVVESVPSLTRSREFPAPYITSVNLGPLNRATYQAASLATLMFRRELEAPLKKLPAGTRRRAGSQVSLIPVSPQLLVHAAARAGVQPSIVVPFIGDQPFWGNVLYRRGLAPAPIPYWKRTVDRLTDTLGQAESCRDEAAQTGEIMRNEDGASAAVDVLENLAR